MRPTRLVILSMTGMALASGVAWACAAPSAGAASTELAPLARLEIDASWLRRPEPETLGLPSTAVALTTPERPIVPVARPALGRPLVKAPLPATAPQQRRVSKTSFATAPAAAKQHSPGLRTSRPAPPSPPQVVPTPPTRLTPRAVESLERPTSMSSARPASTTSSF